ncbi:MAG: hypothetical protein AAFV93_21780 [Chloroflexota bacterium]
MSELLLNPRVIFLAFIWGLFLVLFLRALTHKRVASRQARLIWMIYFVCCIAFSFWGESSEIALDQVVGFDHVAVFIKYSALSIVAHLFYLLLSDVEPDHSLIPMKHIVPMTLSAGIFGLIVANQSSILTTEQFRYLFIAARDGVVTFYILMSFIPGIVAMYRAETVKLMRLKLVFILVLCACFLFTSLGSLVAFVWAMTHWGNPSVPASLVQPFVVAGMLCFILTMIPYRWFMRLVHFQQFYTYQRLRDLEKRIFQKIDKDIRQTPKFQMTQDLKSLELQIYQTTISILDHYPLLLKYDTTASLHDEVDDCKQNAPDYDKLIRRLTRV